MSCIVGIGGAHSGAGKTEAAGALLRGLPGWGAVKCARTHLYTSVVSDERILRQQGKDTARYFESGAAAVLWVQSAPADMAETVEMACDRMGHLPGILVEGNSAIEVLNPDVVIFIFDETLRLKPGADRVLARADAVVAAPGASLPEGTPADARVFGRDELEALARHVAALVEERCLKP
jgi:molybdopterin-guanine dinucleotide biosynthesis protein